MRAAPGTVLHFSEDPDIVEFAPRVAPTSADPEPGVWAVDHTRSADYWFPRQCPRAMAWVTETTTDADRLSVLGPAARRVHMIEYGWLEPLRTVQLYAYAFDAADFRPHADDPSSHAHVARRQCDRSVRPGRSGTCSGCTRRPASSCVWSTPSGRGGMR